MAKEKKQDIERRLIGFSEGTVEVRQDSEGKNKIIGEAIVFERESNPIFGEFVEVIKRGALDEADMSRIVARTNHNDDFLLGTTMGGTLTVREHAGGLNYEVDIPDTVAGRDTKTYIDRGDISGSSFAFMPDYRNGGVKWVDRSEDGLLDLREIHKIKGIYDVSPVINPAYPDSSTALRDYRDWKEERQRSVKDEDELEQRKLKADSDTLKAKYNQLKLKKR